MPFKDKRIVLTGATGGLGQALVKALAPQGCHLFLCGRSVGALEDLDDFIRARGSKVTLIPLDLREFDKIEAFGPSLMARGELPDFFIGAAGYFEGLTLLTHQPLKVWQQSFDVNLTANWCFLKTLEPLLKISRGHAVFISSEVAHRPLPYWGAYELSKKALEAMVDLYHAENPTPAFQLSLFDPGDMATVMYQKAYPGVDLSTLPSPDEVARTLLNRLTGEEPDARVANV